jgi:meiotically up-regulated gene 157 (Mug157) protein
MPFTSQRPAAADRTFISTAVEAAISTISAAIADPQLAWLFANCFPNTLDTTVDFELIDGKPDTFVITGDIDAMWLRDSTAQVWPYLPLINQDDALKQMIAGLINRQGKCIRHDPYANAFYKDLSIRSKWASDEPSPIPGVHERKWELDSLCYVIRLADGYYQATQDLSPFDDDWAAAMRLLLDTLVTEQRHDGSTPYRFVRNTPVPLDSCVHQGRGRPIRATGLICSAFRPSDDGCLFPFLIPSNLFASWALRRLAAIWQATAREAAFATRCHDLAAEIDTAIGEHAIVEHLDFGPIYAYEVDGFGNRVFMDDANVPSLMSLAYLGIHQPEDAVYAATRRFLLSDSNPYFLRGRAASGQASPHSGTSNIWPMGIILRAFTSRDDDEIRECLRMLVATHAGTGFMHESFNKDDASTFTRKWFAWANTLFGELIMKLHHERPHLLGGQY